MGGDGGGGDRAGEGVKREGSRGRAASLYRRYVGGLSVLRRAGSSGEGCEMVKHRSGGCADREGENLTSTLAGILVVEMAAVSAASLPPPFFPGGALTFLPAAAAAMAAASADAAAAAAAAASSSVTTAKRCELECQATLRPLPVAILTRVRKEGGTIRGKEIQATLRTLPVAILTRISRGGAGHL